MAIGLYDYQLDAIKNMKNGCILCGGVGSGKSRTALGYYFVRNGGKVDTKNYVPMKCPRDLYIITTAHKRDTLEWCGDMAPFLLSTDPKTNAYKNKIIIDSWNNIKKYIEIRDAFFIFDEQRVVGSGAWVKAFLKIARNNEWILLSATPGDTWSDYIPVFIANGFYRNRSAFITEHVIYSRFSKYPKIDRYISETKLRMLRDSILVNMDFKRPTVSHHEDVICEYDKIVYKDVIRDRWNIFEKRPVVNSAELCYLLRKVVNSDETRQDAVLRLVKEHPKVIIFYNFDYELDILKSIGYGKSIEVAEWNGHEHQKIPGGEKWVYLVQYSAGCEGWNTTDTDTVIFFSQNYSYKVMVQASGRIDRLNTPFTDLYYYHLRSMASIDIAIARALNSKKKFNEEKFVKWQTR